MWHPTHSPIVTCIVCSVIRGVAFQGNHGDIRTTTLTWEHTAEGVLCGNDLSPGSTESENMDSSPSLRFSSTSAALYLIPMI